MNESGLNPIVAAARLWQDRGWQVVPAQPNSKHLVAGFGIYQNKVEPGESVEFWFQRRNVNLAAVAPPGKGVILDFDEIEVYFQFAKQWPELAASYTESTPRTGRHLFLWTSQPVPHGMVLVPGIEVKYLCLVSPSKVGGQCYRMVVPGDILTGNVLEALQPFVLEPEYRLPLPPIVHVLGRPVLGKGHVSNGRLFIKEIKERWPILNYLAYFEPGLILTGRGRWLAGLCPWHDDTRPSMWIDTSRNLWGCHACSAHGDILNWHARRLELESIGVAMRDLARYRVEGRQ